ncbi:hypothetical protein SAMN05216600_11375 [Pseudomonas cuatrocienegasensis]|uniref:Uncharacterized protein n=2 Tax=Pseudomonas TaxID=286 RepID=A0ABY1BJL8_9PSED|nr:hypothetical protein SAMN05216600_11375 [Pseudomonas cuatrocienegasensis]
MQRQPALGIDPGLPLRQLQTQTRRTEGTGDGISRLIIGCQQLQVDNAIAIHLLQQRPTQLLLAPAGRGIHRSQQAVALGRAELQLGIQLPGSALDLQCHPVEQPRTVQPGLQPQLGVFGGR